MSYPNTTCALGKTLPPCQQCVPSDETGAARRPPRVWFDERFFCEVFFFFQATGLKQGQAGMVLTDIHLPLSFESLD